MSSNIQQKHLAQLFKKYSQAFSPKTDAQQSAEQYKPVLDSLNLALNSLQQNNTLLSNEFQAATERLKQQHEDIIRRQLLDLIDIYDRLQAAMPVLEHYKPVKSVFKNSRKKDINFIKRIKQGQRMTLSRLEQLLYHYQLRPINCVGQVFDSATMHAIETACITEQKNGIVLEELQSGFFYQDKVIRLAEVKVNKITTEKNHE